MATEDIKVVTIPQESLQQVDPNNNYVIRFRISNEDGSQKSSWSPYLTVPAKAISTIPSTSMTISSTADIISLQWAVTEGSYRPLYDVFIRYGSSSNLSAIPYDYLDTVSTPFATSLDPGSVSHAQFKVQVAGLTKELNNNLLLGESVVTVI